MCFRIDYFYIGAGKSTFIESLGVYLTNLGHYVAVLAIGWMLMYTICSI